jgi:hypothetical protein
MLKSWQNLILVIAVFSLTACGAELPRRYKSMSVERQAPREVLVRASALVMERPKSDEEPAVLQLSAEGQASLISAIAQVESSVAGLYQNLAKGFKKQPATDVIDRSQITRRIVFSTQKTDLAGESADRISRLEFRLEFSPTSLADHLQFHQWNRFETEYGEVDLGKIGVKKGTEISAKLSPTFGGTLNAGEAGITASREVSEELNLRQRFIALTGILDINRAMLVQEGVVGIDLSGNTSIDLSIKFVPAEIDSDQIVKFDSFRTSKGLKTADEVSYRVIPIYIPSLNVVNKLKNGVLCQLSGNYVLRHVRKGGETIIEGDDVVVFFRGSLQVTPNPISLMSGEQIQQLRARFFIHPLGKEGENLAIDHSRNPTQRLDFATYQEADEFLDWITTQNAITVGGRNLKLNQKPLAQTDIAALRIGIRE